VWLWTDGRNTHPSYSSSEFAINGPSYSIYAGDTLPPNCGKTVTTMYLNYDAVEANAVHSYAHTFDDALMIFFNTPSGYQTCDWATLHYNSYGLVPDGRCSGSYTPNDTYGFTARPNQYNGNVGMCGNVEQPPNQDAADGQSYNYSQAQSRNSRCMDWQWNGGTVTSVSCSTWNCEVCPNPQTDPAGYYYCNTQRNQRKYLIWWMQNIPGLNNNSHDRNGVIRLNYWALKFQ
jgi:hypothetical protein